MNYGRFFRLNQSLSKVVDGVAIYDYIELPAYFGPSEENKMSPKYPVSVTITANSVRFRLHYSVYKVETDMNSEYGYSVDDIHQVMDGSTKGIKMAHMEEVIFELPYINDATDRLASTIKELYSTKFPQRIDDNRAEGSNSSGGRFLEQLIKKRFPLKGEGETDSIKNSLYKSMREALDKLPSYSSLWLMDLIKGEGKDQYVDVFEKGIGIEKGDNDRDIVGFLRKLILDFMFDLKHSDIFQNSVYYQTMYSGLMSDFYFSALMHKCEYYYYRELILDEIQSGHREENGKLNKEFTDRITILYAEELFKVEELWTRDIMSPSADKWFETQEKNKILEENGEKRWKRNGSNWDIWESEQTNVVNAWFADPEEEMKRVCFPMWDKQKMCHLCNAETMTAYLKIEEDNKYEEIGRRMLESRNTNRELVSRWFLLRCDFLDVIHLHLHMSGWTNAVLIALAILGLFAIFFANSIQIKLMPTIQRMMSSSSYQIDWLYPYFLPIAILVTLWFVWFVLKCRQQNTSDILLDTYYNMGSTRVKRVCLIITVTIAIILLLPIILKMLQIFAERYHIPILLEHLDIWQPIIIIISIAFLWFMFRKKESSIKKMIAGLHLFFPRLVASIATAWLTIAMTYDILNSFFDKAIPWLMIFGIMIIPFGFVLYEINRITPYNLIWKKISRTLELLLVSYCISILIGVVAIDFVGENFMERGGFVDDFYTEYDAYAGNATRSNQPIENGEIAQKVGDNINDYSIAHNIKELAVLENQIGQIEYNDTFEGGVILKHKSANTLEGDLLLTKKNNYIYVEKMKAQKDSIETMMNTSLPSTKAKKVEYLENVKDDEGNPVLSFVHIGEYKIFFMRNFLFTFSFFAVFIGIFLQMMFFETKQMTEL